MTVKDATSPQGTPAVLNDRLTGCTCAVAALLGDLESIYPLEQAPA